MKQVSTYRNGFSLIEVLTVMTIMATLFYLVGPAIGGLMLGKGMTANVSDMANVLEEAREAAIAQNTFVWVGLESVKFNGNGEIAIAVIAANSGQAADLANANCHPLIKPMFLPSLSLDGTDYLALSGVSSSNTDIAQSTYTFTQILPRSSTPTTFQAIQFAPDGEASLSAGVPASRYLGIGLAGGPIDAVHHQYAGIQVSGLTGHASVYRQ